MIEYDCSCGRLPGLKCDGNCDVHPTVDKRTAIADRRDQIASQARPSTLSSVDIIGEVAQVRETADLFKVYRPEWIIVFVSLASGEAGKEEAQEFFDKKYEGRVRDDDVRVVPTSKTHPEKYPLCLELHLPNIKGEWKRREDAEAYVAEQGWADAVVVSRNSRDEHQLKEYSKKKLPKVR